MRLAHACDDGNVEDGDGCSSICEVEESFTCSGGGVSSADVCRLLTTLAITSSLFDLESYSLSLALTKAVLLNDFNIDHIHISYLEAPPSLPFTLSL